MGKKTITGTKNVYELAQERLKVIFNEFDNIYVSFSGGYCSICVSTISGGII